MGKRYDMNMEKKTLMKKNIVKNGALLMVAMMGGMLVSACAPGTSMPDGDQPANDPYVAITHATDGALPDGGRVQE